MYFIAISLWEFGRIEVMEIFPAFVVKTRRPNRTVVFVNICSCRGVPHNQNGLDKDDGILYMCCGEKGITANDHSVYDIAVSPTLVTLARKDRAILTKVNNIPNFHHFSGSYSFDRFVNKL